jgi:hypothetical protein
LALLLLDELHFYIHRIKAHHGLGFGAHSPLMCREADVALGAPGVPVRQKREIRELMAFCGELYGSSDQEPPGYNVHGNTDYVAIYNVTRSNIGCLLNGHPHARKWAQAGIRAIHDALKAKDELPGFSQDEWYASLTLEIVTYGAIPLQRAGFADLFDDQRLRDGYDFCGNLLVPPDPRHKNCGSVVPFGNGMGDRNRSAVYAIAAAALAPKAPDMASRLMWYWQRCGQPGALRISGDRDDSGWSSLGWINPDIAVVNPRLESACLSGWGALFRNAYGGPRETFMALQLGKPAGLMHYNAEGGFHLYAQGMPLCLISGIRGYDAGIHSGFAVLTRTRWMANRPSFDYRNEEETSGSTGRLLDWKSTSTADLASGQWTFSQLKALPNPGPAGGDGRLILTKPRPTIAGASAGHPIDETVTPITWRRHVLFVKDPEPTGPNYFVIRDVAQTAVPWDWSVWCLAHDERLQDNAAHFTGKFGVDLDLTPMTRTPEIVTGSYGPTQSFAGDWHQKVFQVRLPPQAGQMAAVLYPRAHDQPAPTIVPWAGGAGAKISLPGQTHYVLLADQPGEIREGAFRIRGRAAVIRETGQATLLCLLAGSEISTPVFGLATTGAGAVSVALDPAAKRVAGESRGSPDRITLRAGLIGSSAALLLDGKAAQGVGVANGSIRFSVPEGNHHFDLKY